jgi:hypothetical protein
MQNIVIMDGKTHQEVEVGKMSQRKARQARQDFKTRYPNLIKLEETETISKGIAAFVDFLYAKDYQIGHWGNDGEIFSPSYQFDLKVQIAEFLGVNLDEAELERETLLKETIKNG